MSHAFTPRPAAIGLALALLAGCQATAPVATPPSAAPAAHLSPATATLESPAPVVTPAPVRLAGQALFRGEPLAGAAVSVVDATSGALLATDDVRADAAGRFELRLPAGSRWVRVLATIGPSTLSAVTRIDAPRAVLAADGLRIDEVSTAVTQMSQGLFLALGHLSPDEAEQARARLLEQLQAHAAAFERAFRQQPQLVNRLAEASDPASGLATTHWPVEQAAQAAGAFEAYQQVVRDGMAEVVEALRHAEGQAPALSESAPFVLGPWLQGSVRSGKLHVRGARGQEAVLSSGDGSLAALAASFESGAFFRPAPAPALNPAPAAAVDPGSSVAFTRMIPVEGPAGTEVTIEGTGFDAGTPGANVVRFNGVAATVTAASETRLTVTVPAGASSGTVEVTAHGRTAASPSEFKYGTAITVGSTTTDSRTTGTAGDLFLGGDWRNAAGTSGWARRNFGETVSIQEINVGYAWSDKAYRPLDHLYVEVSNDGTHWTEVAHATGNQSGYRKVLDAPVEAEYLRLRLVGNGWFGAGQVSLRSY